jgi:hypothetical protein
MKLRYLLSAAVALTVTSSATAGGVGQQFGALDAELSTGPQCALHRSDDKAQKEDGSSSDKSNRYESVSATSVASAAE